MKKTRLIFAALCALALMVGFSSCNSGGYGAPTLEVVNATSYYAVVTFDNNIVATVAPNSSQTAIISGGAYLIRVSFCRTSSTATRVAAYSWTGYRINDMWDYKMYCTSANSAPSLQVK